MTPSRSAILFPGLLITVIAASLVLMRESILLKIGDYLIIEDDLTNADVVHVIAGEDYRTDYAVQLYQQGYAKRIFFTGGWCDIHDYYHGRHGLERALSQGVSEQAIAYDDKPVKSTYDEALRMKAYIEQSQAPVQSVIVVSDPFHMRRARWTYRRVLGNDIKILMAPVPFELTPLRARWWEEVQSQAYVKDEYQKLVYYVARYQFSWGPFRDWLASLDRE
jgi:uncharacterized SAM-binding protein YcdF (DUF218 family)